MFQTKAFQQQMLTRDLLSLLLFTCLIFLLLSVAPFAKSQERVSREKGKAIFIYNIFRSVKWSGEKQLGHFRVGLYGKDPVLMRELKKELLEKKVRGKKVKFTSIFDLDKARQLQALIVSPSYNRYINKIAIKLRQSKTLLITEGVDDKRNVMINFVSSSTNRLAFEVNRSSILYEGITPSKNLLLFGGTELDIAVIHKETEEELTQAVSAVEKKSEEIETQQKLLKKQMKDISLQKVDIKKKSERITEQESRITEQEDRIRRQSEKINNREAELSRLEGNLLSIKEALNASEGMLSERKSTIAKKEADINTYSAQIRENLRKLDSQKQELEKQEALITKKNSVLSEQDNTIKNQQLILTFAVGALITFFTLVIIIFKGYKAKQKVNKMLGNKTSELESANEKLLQMSEAKSQFLSTMSHEIRTPLNGVLGMVELLQDTPVNEQQRHYLDIVHTSGEMLSSVINDILDYSKIEAGKMSVESIAFNLEKLIFDCAPVFVQRTTAELSLVVDIPASTPLHVMGDPTRIRQILLNFLSNAFKFTSVGEIRLIAQTSTPIDGQLYYSISVSDTGVGLTEQQCNKLFKAFGQADSSTTRRYGGTGLGLVISMRLAKLMGGSITVESEFGKGSSFILTLPQMPSGEVEPVVDTVLAGKSLLIVDPNISRQQFFADHAKVWKMKVITAATQTAMRQVLEKGPPSIVIVADHVESQDGLSVATQLARELSDSKIMLQNSAVAPVLEKQFENTGIAAVFEMPIAPSRLRETLAKALGLETLSASNHATDKNNQRKQFNDAKVLVVEDNAVNQIVIKGMLGKMDIQPEVANNGLEAVNIYREKCCTKGSAAPYDIILMDCEMPELDGLSATRQIRALESDKGSDPVVIVALTAHAMDAHKEKAFSAGMNEHLSKPIKFDRLQEMLSNFIA